MRGTRELAHPHRKTTTLSFTNWPAPWPSGELRVNAFDAECQSPTVSQCYWGCNRGARIYTIGLAGGVRHVVPGTERTRERKSHG